MKLMGLSSWLHWGAWLFKYFIFMMIATVIMAILLSVKVCEILFFKVKEEV